nr:hypothetical protein [Tanacetum cinerariifolium]
MTDKAHKRGKKFNWETSTYDKVYCDDLDPFTDSEIDFPAIVYNDASTSNENVLSEPSVSIYNAIKANINFNISFSDSDDEDYTFIYDKNSLSHKLIHVDDLKLELDDGNGIIDLQVEDPSVSQVIEDGRLSGELGIMTELVMKECMEKAQANSDSCIAKPKFDDNLKIEPSKEILKASRINAFN